MVTATTWGKTYDITIRIKNSYQITFTQERIKNIEGEEERVISNFSVTGESPACTKNRLLLHVY